MITYFKMKRDEWKVKAQFYGMVAQLIDNQKDIISALENLFVALKDESVSSQPESTKTAV